MQTEDRRTHSFFKGISLQQYMRDVCCGEGNEMDEENEETNDLYLHPEPQQDLATYAIKQIVDEDNYDETNQHQQFIVQPLHHFDLQRARIVHIEDNKSKPRINIFKRSNLRQPKNNSNSPYKDIQSPKKQMFRSLYGHSFATEQAKQPQKTHLLSTLGMSGWQGKKGFGRKEVDQRQKNRRQYQQIIKYENIVNQRLDTRLNSIRIEGIKDKIHDRHERFNRKDQRL